MCGIAGYFGNKTVDEKRIDHCIALMNRRGPDFAAYERFVNSAGKNVYLLFSRLSIIDLDDRANQPFHVDSKTMVFNGEYYNYLEVRSELEAAGSHFRTQSDTEVLLSTINQWGWQGLERCEGMWAFAVYDSEAGSLLLSRDRFGEKPLYLYQDDTGLYFGSEIKFVMALAGHRLEVNYDQLYRYLVNGYKALYKQPATFFQGLRELPPASVLICDAEGRQREHKYWLPCYEPDESMTYDQAVSQSREKLIRSVELRLRADVPLAFCMSGGVDSNALISIARRVFDYDVHGFTIVNQDERYEETELVNYAVEELGIRHTSILVNPSGFLPKLRELVRYHDSPIVTITYFAHWLLMESIAQHKYRISISGTAADELYTGYYDHHLAYLYEVRNEPELHAAAVDAWTQHIKPIVRNPYLSDPDRFVNAPNFRDHIFLNSDQFAEYLICPWEERFSETYYTDSLLRNRMMNEIFHESVPVILHEDDLNAMYYSIENRSPFLDRRLFEFCYSIPSRHLIRNGCAKAVLRDSMRGIVPDHIIDNRRKVGFNAPIFSFLDVKEPSVRRELLDDSPIYDHIRREKIVQLLDKNDLPNSESKFLFYFLSTKLFLEEFS